MDHINAVQEIVPKQSASHQFIKIATRCCHDTGINGYRPRVTHPLHLAFLEKSQELYLRALTQFAHLIKEKGAPVGQLDAADSTFRRACKRATFVTEKL
jgi:hypothetical protein